MDRTGAKLLIVEDEEPIRNSISNYIRRNSTRIDTVYTAENGQEALDIIFRVRPQVMLLDIQLPIKDGITVMKEAKAADVMPRTIILSGYDEFRYAQQALRYGAVDYLLKPCRSTEILSKVEALLQDDLPPGPGEAEGQDSSVPGNSFVQEATEYIREHYPEELTLTLVAEAIGITPSYLSTLFKRTLGYGFVDYLNQERIERACGYFVDNRIKTYEVAFKVGFKDEKYFSSVFRKVKGISPSEYRKSLR